MLFLKFLQGFASVHVADDASQAALERHFDRCLVGRGVAARVRLPRIILWGGRAGRLLTWAANAQGITFGRHVFWNPKCFPGFDPSGCALDQMGRFLVHEAAHVGQYARDGTARFLWRYVADYVRLLRLEGRLTASARYRAYLAIPYEIEARRAEEEWKTMNDER